MKGLLKMKNIETDANYEVFDIVNVKVGRKEYSIKIERRKDDTFTFYLCTTYINNVRYGIIFPISNEFDGIGQIQTVYEPMRDKFVKFLKNTIKGIS